MVNQSIVAETQTAADKWQFDIQALMDKRKDVDDLKATKTTLVKAVDVDSVDSIIGNVTTADYRGAAASRSQRHAELDLLSAISARLAHTLIPAACIEKLRAQVAHQGALVKLHEAEALVLIAKKLHVLGPVIDAEGSSLVIEGGASSDALKIVIEARSTYAKMCGALYLAEEQFKVSQQQ